MAFTLSDISPCSSLGGHRQRQDQIDKEIDFIQAIAVGKAPQTSRLEYISVFYGFYNNHKMSGLNNGKLLSYSSGVQNKL